MTDIEYNDPNWLPLEAHLHVDDLGAWMWMCRIRHDDKVIEQYKHRDTRRYLNLDQFAEAWRVQFPIGCDPWCDEAHEHVTILPPTFEQIPFAEALEWALS